MHIFTLWQGVSCGTILRLLGQFRYGIGRVKLKTVWNRINVVHAQQEVCGALNHDILILPNLSKSIALHSTVEHLTQVKL